MWAVGLRVEASLIRGPFREILQEFGVYSFFEGLIQRVRILRSEFGVWRAVCGDLSLRAQFAHAARSDLIGKEN